MATATKKKSTVKEKVQKVGQNAREYKQAMDAAYDLGYQAGYEAATQIPKVPGAKLAARTGYGRGVSANRKVGKIRAKVRKK